MELVTPPHSKHVAIWLTPWRLVCWRARVLLGLLLLGGVLDAVRLLR